MSTSRDFKISKYTLYSTKQNKYWHQFFVQFVHARPQENTISLFTSETGSNKKLSYH